MGVRRLAAAACAAMVASWAASARAEIPSSPSAQAGGRPAALGRAYTALADDVYAPIWNPAGLAGQGSPSAALLYGDDAGERRAGAAAAFPLGAAHGAGISADAGGGRSYYGLSYGRAVGAAALGAAARYFDDSTGHGYAADLSGLYRFDERLTVALVAGGLGRAEPQTRLAAGYVIGRRLAYALEGVTGRGSRGGVRTGFELSAMEIFSARLGVDTTLENSSLLGLTAGVGLGWKGHSVDLGYIPQGSRSLTQLTVALNFGRRDGSRRLSGGDSVTGAAKPSQVSPSAVRSVSFHLEPSSSPLSGFIANPEEPDWAKPKRAILPEKPELIERSQPDMIWFQ